MALDLDDMTAIAPRDSASLPDGWRTMRFGDVVRNVDTYDHNPLVSGLERYVGLEHLDPESLHVKRWGLIADGTSFTRRFAAGQVLFGKRRAYQRKAAVAAFDGICSGDILVFEANGARLLPELLPFIVQSDGFFAHALGTSAGSLSPRTKWRDLANYQFALPPLHEQRRIADILWAADASCEHWSDVIGPFAVLRQAALDDFFRGEGSATTAVPIVPLEDVCLMQNGRPFPSNDYCEEGTRLLRPGNLGDDGYINWNSEATRYLPEEYRTLAADYLIDEGDVVINLTAQSLEDGFMGRVCLARHGDTSLLNQRIGRFVCRDTVLQEYLYRSLQTSAFRELAETRCEGSKVRHLYWRHIRDYAIPLPALEQQCQVVTQLAAIDRAIALAKANLVNVTALRKVLREQLLTINNGNA